MAIDENEEKMVFLVKMLFNDRDQKPKLVSYLTSIPKTLQKILS